VRSQIPVLLLIGLGGCASPAQIADLDWTPVPAADLGGIVARVGPVPIYDSQVLAEAKRSGKSTRGALDALVATNLLAERARQDGWSLVGSSEAEVKSALVQRFLERDLEPNIRAGAVPDSALRPVYDRARDAFIHPRLVEIGVLAVYTGARMAEESRQERAQLAKKLDAFLKGHPANTLDAFSAVARDPVWSGMVAFGKFIQGLDRPLSRTVGEEVAKLRSVGETTRMLTDEDGFFIARYIGERPPANVTFEQARGKLLAGLYENWRQQQFMEFTAKLFQGHKVVAYFDRLPPVD
jgi:hypothetical protein